jgi:hypothetical protein
VRFTISIRRFSLPTGRAEDFALEIEFHDQAGVAVRHEHMLVAAHAQTAGGAGML